mmetsp:Transcript_35009/g.90697  ORF Transcript_35009/g.90697 Transcript_35009/m.90697 type:complete len:342 (+) Transcript_35009:77-1102(+)
MVLISRVFGRFQVKSLASLGVRVYGSTAGKAVYKPGSRDKTINVYGVPIDFGGERRGVDCGPSAIRFAHIHDELESLGYKVVDKGNMPVMQQEQLESPGTANNAGPARDVAAEAGRVVENIVLDGGFPLVLGGDHSISAGTCAGHQRARAALDKSPLGLLWFDAKASVRTPETSETQNLHSMSLAALLGLEIPGLSEAVGEHTFDPKRVCVVGARELSACERQLLQKLGVHVFTMRSVDEHQMVNVIRRALKIVAPNDEDDSFLLSLDMEVFDPEVAPGVGTALPGGISYREGHLAMEIISDHGGLRGVDLVEVNPITDTANRTAHCAVEMVASALGKSIM